MIGYYVHNHGWGHFQRALAIARHLGDEVTLLGSLGPGTEIPGNYLELVRDDLPCPVPGGDTTAGGSLHWVPLNHAGLRQRQAVLAEWLTRAECRLLVSDVSVETLLLARLLSVPPVAVALRGDRTDRPHAAGYDAAVRILAPWPREIQHEWPERWLKKTTWLGMISRFDGRPHERRLCEVSGRCVVMMLGRGGHRLLPADIAEATAVDGVHWHVLGDAGPRPQLEPPAAARLVLHGDVPDPWPLLCSADVVVTSAGDASIADVAAARAPLVAIPQQRPFGEQVEHVRVLTRLGLCVAATPWPSHRDWPALLEQARRIGGEAWADQCDGRGAERAAHTLHQLATNPHGSLSYA